MMGGWLARLKIKKSHTTHATKPTKPPADFLDTPQEIRYETYKTGFVGFVATPLAPLKKFEGGKQAGNPQPQEPVQPQPVGQGKPSESANESPNPDRHCWPSGDALNTAEIEAFAARLTTFTRKGVGIWDAERMADTLVKRDRDQDERRLCLECTRLQGYSSWRCGNWKQAGLGWNELGSDMACQLQHCPAFTAVRLPLGVVLMNVPAEPCQQKDQGLQYVTPKQSPGYAKVTQYHPVTAGSVDYASAYHSHHFQCSQCISSGLGAGYGHRCSVGLALWNAYNGAT